MTNKETMEILAAYMRLILEENSKINLTAIRNEEDFWEKHIEDSLSLLPYIPQGAKFIDVGTGAGFPGVVIKIARPDVDVTLLDSIGKKIEAVRRCIEKINVDAKILNLRAEDASHMIEYRGVFDFACARALAPLSVSLELCAAFVKMKGIVALMKGPGYSEEMKALNGSEGLLGLKPCKVRKYILSPSGSQHFLCLFEKTSLTPNGYPRNASELKKKPLGR